MSEAVTAFEERKLLARARGGDLEAFEQLLANHQQRLWQWLLARVPPGIDAEDILQQAMFIAYDRLDSFAGESRFGTWLTGIARNCLRNAVRSQRRQSTVPLAAIRQQLDQQALAEDGRQDELAALQYCLGQLGAPLQRLLERFYGRGEAVADIATALARPVGTIKRHLHRARQALQACIRQRLSTAEDEA